ARALDDTVQANPGSPNANQILALFDLGDQNNRPCTNDDGSQSAPGDGRIGVCEAALNPIIQTLLQPDVQLYQNGVFRPNPANTAKEAVYVGLQFSAVPARF